MGDSRYVPCGAEHQFISADDCYPWESIPGLQNTAAVDASHAIRQAVPA